MAKHRVGARDQRGAVKQRSSKRYSKQSLFPLFPLLETRNKLTFTWAAAAAAAAAMVVIVGKPLNT